MFVPSGEKKNLFFTIALSQMKDIANYSKDEFENTIILC